MLLSLTIFLPTANVISKNIFETPPTPETIKFQTTKDIADYSNDTIVFQKNYAFMLGQNVSEFTTLGKYPTLTTYKPAYNECYITLLGFKDENSQQGRVIKNVLELKNLIALRQIGLYPAINKKMDKKFKGYREKVIGKTLEKLLLPTNVYKGTPLVDEYKEKTAFWWTLKDINELKAIAIYMLKNLDDAPVNPDSRPYLVLTIKEDPTLSNLDETIIQFLNEYFQLLDPKDPNVVDFYMQSKKYIFEIMTNMGQSNPDYLNETTIEAIFRNVEKYYKEFDSQKIITAIITTMLILPIFNKDFLIKTTKATYNSIKNAINAIVTPAANSVSTSGNS